MVVTVTYLEPCRVSAGNWPQHLRVMAKHSSVESLGLYY